MEGSGNHSVARWTLEGPSRWPKKREAILKMVCQACGMSMVSDSGSFREEVYMAFNSSTRTELVYHPLI